MNKRKNILLLIVFHIHFVSFQIILTWTLTGRSHTGFDQMLKTIERVSQGSWGLSAQGETHTGTDWTNDKGAPEDLWADSAVIIRFNKINQPQSLLDDITKTWSSHIPDDLQDIKHGLSLIQYYTNYSKAGTFPKEWIIDAHLTKGISIKENYCERIKQHLREWQGQTRSGSEEYSDNPLANKHDLFSQ